MLSFGDQQDNKALRNSAVCIIAVCCAVVACFVLLAACALEGGIHAKASAVPSAASSASAQDESMLQVRYVDVGQGDCALISCGGHHMLIDGGPSKASQRVYAVLKNEGVTHLDAIIATHADADHIGGISAALNAASCGTCYCSTNSSDTETFRSMVKYLNKQGLSITVPQVPTTFNLGGAQISIIGPVRNFGDDNNNSLVCRIDFGNSSFLFMGDAESEAEQAMLRAKVDVHADMVKIGHHGSRHSTLSNFLRAVDPTYAIISVGASNDYGHPSTEVMNRLARVGVEYWRTDQSGDIVATSDGEFIYVSPTKEPVEVASVDTSEVDTETKSGAAAAAGAGASAAAGAAAAGGETNGQEKTYILNKRSHVIHYPDCDSVKRMKDKNKLEFTGTIAQIQEMDSEYHPCGNCNPT